MEKIKEHIYRSREFVALVEAMKQLSPDNPLRVGGAAGSLLAFIAVKIFEETNRQIVLIASDDERGEKLRDDCAVLIGEQNVRFFGARPTHLSQVFDMTASIAQIETLKALTSGLTLLVVASPKSIVEKVPPPDRFKQTTIELASHSEHSFNQLIEKLQELGFERKDFVESYGDFAVRGGILDVFPFVGENPIRVEFWGDSIESIREFDVLSQRSIRELQSASIVPSLSGRSEDSPGEGIVHSPSLFDYLRNDAIIILDEPELIEREINELFTEGARDLFTFSNVLSKIEHFPRILNSIFENRSSQASNSEFHTALDFHATHQPSFSGSISLLIDHLDKLTIDGHAIFLSADSKEEATRLQELIEEEITSPEREEKSSVSVTHRTSDIHPIFTPEAFHSGFTYPSAKLAIFTEHEIFGRLKRRGIPKHRRFKGFTQKELQQLKAGDHVVHIDHGIGTFAGLKKINVGGIEQEVMKLLFLENDVLYVNLNFVNRVQKYSSSEGHTPTLSKLGTADWERMKAKAKRRIKDIARELIALYARRKREQGFAFTLDTHWQKELEASFMYEDTPDQARSTSDVKADMESSSPMDRLICGDVGFGKTEVALRAAFKAVMSGKQVAILVPTTILAIQHYNTFKDRLAKYSVRIEVLNRFRSIKDQKQIVEGLKTGTVDVVIGTHRLLSKDIELKDLGLLVIDEEHRFGVTSKEKLRQLKATVDTLALTATPIPRTLHFSLIGARDLSIIATPPRNRLPIVTELIPGDATGRQIHWQVIREAILAEVHRGGQVYFVHDRVQNIDAVAEQVKSHVPEARVHIAHGQMPGHQLEKTMIDFLERKYDVLVCTKIIESGLDIPNANTIIINRADRFGMAELYQLRGRVGRSNVQACAYLLTPPLSVLPKPTLRRLQAIEEFTELGSGFNLAMRDLEIRGAGNLLGAEQSGFIMEMGFDMYERIMREAVEELKDEEFREIFQSTRTSDVGHPISVEAVIDADIEAFIPELYIESDAERLDIYRRLYKAEIADELAAMKEELRDRFGEYPKEVEHLFTLVDLRLMASRAGFPKISLKGRMFIITLPDTANEQFYGRDSDPNSPFQKIMTKVSALDRKSVQLKQANKELTLQFILSPMNSVKDRLKEARKKLEEIIS